MEKAKTARKKKGPKHPGVVLIKADEGRRIGWRARFKDPDSGRLVKESLDPALTTTEQREAWAVWKSRELVKRRLALEGGATRATGIALSEAIEGYYSGHPQLRPRTLEAYRSATDKLIAWGARHGVHSADDLTPARLIGFRESLVNEPKRAPVKKEPGAPKKKANQGKRQVTGVRRSPYTINRELRAVRTVLGYLRKKRQLPRLNGDDLRDGLERLRATVERIEFLKPHECKQLLESALRHDADTVITRDEEQALRLEAKQQGVSRAKLALVRPSGSTPRYEPIAPFVAFVLFTGCRVGEALALDWKDVDLDALDSEGRMVGEIHLKGAATKTHKARTIGLEVSPALRSLLAAMKLQSGGAGSVFGLTEGLADAAAKRMRVDYGAPEKFGWQMLRRTCGTFLTNAPGIFGAASAFMSANQLGHSVTVAQKHYLGLVRGIPREARTLEAAMQVEDVVGRAVGSATSRGDGLTCTPERGTV